MVYFLFFTHIFLDPLVKPEDDDVVPEDDDVVPEDDGVVPEDDHIVRVYHDNRH